MSDLQFFVQSIRVSFEIFCFVVIILFLVFAIVLPFWNRSK